ncbi:MAG: tetratricopeptide repeat protein [Bacteroidaceae bacterium]|nr:tetratricopeptide repeat protein [Bacteroidaceae bacterium]
MAKKTVKEEPVQGANNIEEALSRSEQFIEKYKNVMVGAVVAVIVIVAGAMLYKSKVVEPKEQRVAEYLFPGENYFMAGQFEVALNGDNMDFMGFEEIARNYGGTKAGNLANAYAGLCCAQLDSCEAAISYLKKFKGDDQMVAPSVMRALADCYVTVGQNDKAIALYQKAAKKADNGLVSPQCLMQAGLVYESMGKNADALKMYKEIQAKYPASSEGIDIEEYITRVTSK